MTRHALLSGLTAVAVGLLAAPAAQADDASLFSAYNARQPQVDAAADAYSRAVKRSNRHPSAKRMRAVIATDRGINAVLAAIKGDLAGQQASSAHGRKARAFAFREVRWWRRANNFEIHAIKLFIRGRNAAGNHLIDRANHTMIRAGRQGRRAVRQFKAVGLKSPLGAIAFE
jgi:hypothetical protein